MQQREIAMQRVLVAWGGVNPRVRLYSRRDPGCTKKLASGSCEETSSFSPVKLQLEVQRNPSEVLTVTREGSSSKFSWSVFCAKQVLAFLKCFVYFNLLVVAARDVNALKKHQLRMRCGRQ